MKLQVCFFENKLNFKVEIKIFSNNDFNLGEIVVVKNENTSTSNNIQPTVIKNRFFLFLKKRNLNSICSKKKN